MRLSPCAVIVAGGITVFSGFDLGYAADLRRGFDRGLNLPVLLDRHLAGVPFVCARLLAVTRGGADVQRTPLGLMYGIEFHAQWLDGFLSNRLLTRPAIVFWIELAAVLVGGLVMVFAVRYARPMVAAGAVMGAVAALLIAELMLFSFGWLFDGVYPAATALASFGAMLLSSLDVAHGAFRRMGTGFRR